MFKVKNTKMLKVMLKLAKMLKVKNTKKLKVKITKMLKVKNY